MTAELKTVHSFWTPVRILDELRSIVEELEKKQGIKISTNQLAIHLIDTGLKDEKILTEMVMKKNE